MLPITKKFQLSAILRRFQLYYWLVQKRSSILIKQTKNYAEVNLCIYELLSCAEDMYINEIQQIRLFELLYW